MTSDFFETLVKMEHRNKAKKKKREQRTGEMADQSLNEPDAEQTCQEMLALTSKKHQY